MKTQMPGPVFISYCREDLDFTLRLIEDLRNSGVDIWFDANIRGGEAWANSIEEAVQSAGTVIVILSPDSRNSQEVGNEIAYALSHQKRIIPVLYKPCDPPLRLASLNRHDFTKNYREALQDLAADVKGEFRERRHSDHTKRWYQKPVVWWSAGLLAAGFAGTVLFFLIRDPKPMNTKGKILPTGAETAKPKPISMRLDGMVQSRAVRMLIVHLKQLQQVSGVYFYTTDPAKQFPLTGTFSNGKMELDQLAGDRVTARFTIVKTSQDCFAGHRRATADHSPDEEVRLCFPKKTNSVPEFQITPEMRRILSR